MIKLNVLIYQVSIWKDYTKNN